MYIVTLVATLISEVTLGYCFLSEWEFRLRKKARPDLEYDSTFLSYYFYRLSGINIPAVYIRYPAIAFLVLSLGFAFSKFL